jgi:hypothetical protein
MKEYFESLKSKFYNALEDVKKDDNQRVYMVGCRDAGNYDYLFIVGSIMPGQYKVIHIDYESLLVTDDLKVADGWFEQMDDGFYEQYEDLFESEWVSMDVLKDHMAYYVEHYI